MTMKLIFYKRHSFQSYQLACPDEKPKCLSVMNEKGIFRDIPAHEVSDAIYVALDRLFRGRTEWKEIASEDEL